MIDLPTISREELVDRIKVSLQSKPYKSHYCEYSAAPAPTEPAA
jgi:hypothetical protein